MKYWNANLKAKSWELSQRSFTDVNVVEKTSLSWCVAYHYYFGEEPTIPGLVFENGQVFFSKFLTG